MPRTPTVDLLCPASSGRRQVGRHPCSAGSRCVLASGAVACRLVVIVGLGLSLLACARISAPPHIGKTSRPENRVPLASLPAGENTWRAEDLDIHYNVARAGDTLEISGFVEFGSNMAKFPLINYFRVYLHFIDADGRVDDSKLLWATGMRTETRFVRWTFQRQWPIPPEAVAMGFSYRGAATEAGGDGDLGTAKTGWDVYQAP